MIFIPFIFFSLAFFSLLCYGTIISYALYGFGAKRAAIQTAQSENPYLEVIIAFRNEAHHLPQLLASLNRQDYKNFCVLFIDDYSTDKSVELILKSNNHQRFTIVKNSGKGKKAAIRTGIQRSKASFLVFTDADCTTPHTWLSTYAQLFTQNSSSLYFGWVTYQWKTSLQRIFSLEFISLTGIGMGLAKAGTPIYMNGANYAISRNLFDKVRIENGENFASGDDVFLLHAIKNQLGSKHIIACADSQIAVTTPAPQNLSAFIKQRIRWGGKTVAYNDLPALSVAIVVFSLSLMQIVALCFLKLWPWVALLWTLKSIIDFAALWQFQHHSPAKKLISAYPLFFLFYPFYLTHTALCGFFSNKKEWLR